MLLTRFHCTCSVLLCCPSFCLPSSLDAFITITNNWLPVKSRISFKILLLTFQCLHNVAPSYLQELLKKYTPVRSLRSSQKNLLECPVLGTRFYGEHAFSFGGPLLWNAVPLHLKEANSVNNFKSLLKTFLFQEYYNWEYIRCSPLLFFYLLTFFLFQRIETQWQCYALYKNCCY